MLRLVIRGNQGPPRPSFVFLYESVVLLGIRKDLLRGAVAKTPLRRSPKSKESSRTFSIADAHRDGKRFVVHADEKLTAFLELEAAIHRQPASSQRPTAQPPMLNSARRHCTSPRRGRRVEWSDQRRGDVRLHFRSRRSCRRCACDAS